jgi:hypothetical protein
VGVVHREVAVESFGDVIDLNDRPSGGWVLVPSVAGGVFGGCGAGLGQDPTSFPRSADRRFSLSVPTLTSVA